MHEDTHAMTSLEHFGREFREVHRFLDQYFRHFDTVHRTVFHHKRGLDVIEARFGHEARAAAELHIQEDTEGDLPEDWNYYKGDWNPLMERDRAEVLKVMKQHYGEGFTMAEKKKQVAKCPMCGEALESVYMTVQCEACGWFADAQRFAEMVEDGEIAVD